MTAKGVPLYTPDIFAPEAIQAPASVYEDLRALGPVVWLEASGCWVTTTYAAAHHVLSNDDLFRSGRGVSLNDRVNRVLVGSTLNSDGNDHSRRKRVSIRPLMPVNLAPLEVQISAASAALVARLPDQVEAVSHIARHLPLSIVTQLVGVPASREQDLLRWASATFNSMGPDNDLARAAADDLADLRRFVTDPMVERRLTPGGWAAALFLAEKDGKIPGGWAREQMRDYLNPALDTTIAATAFGLQYFADNPDQWDLLRTQPELVGNAVEEIVRLSTPIRGFSRYVDQQTWVEGTRLDQGVRIFVLFALANRDPLKFPDAERFDIRRDTKGHVGFGHGRHFCLGMHLARMEMRCMLSALATRVKRFTRLGEPVRAINNTIHGLESLPLALEFD